tara:strand:+ start:1356 stop:2957 length:1602 start_codon:yes stop_codon:yes gene_type:complete
MEKKSYNRFFHLHTVSGIVISVALYVIFFAGAFSLFRHEIGHWENQKVIPLEEQNVSTNSKMDIDYFVNVLKKEKYDLNGREIYLTLENKRDQELYISESKDTLSANASKEYELTINTNTNKITEQTNEFYSLGSLLYLLHYFYQLGEFGEYLAGLVAVFFLFAIVTGVVVHWKKIVSNFYVFRPLAKLKTIWTDAHTVLGVIGLPFQFMYALTGAMFALAVLIYAPTDLLAHKEDNKTTKIEEFHSDFVMDSNYLLNPIIDSLATKWPDFTPKYIGISNYGSEKGTINLYGYLDARTKFIHEGEITYNIHSRKVTSESNPYNVAYTDIIRPIAWALHYGYYGDIGILNKVLLKTLYFLMAIITCFVIISGVLIWLTARDKKNIPEKQRRYNEKVGYIYMALCLTMFPITAFSFIVSKLLSGSTQSEVILNSVYFGGWLLMSILFWLKKDNYFTNKYTLLSGGLLSLCIPVVNGFSSGNWLWKTFSNQYYDIFTIDVLWLAIGVLTLYTFTRMKKTNTKTPIFASTITQHEIK